MIKERGEFSVWWRVEGRDRCPHDGGAKRDCPNCVQQMARRGGCERCEDAVEVPTVYENCKRDEPHVIVTSTTGGCPVCEIERLERELAEYKKHLGDSFKVTDQLSERAEQAEAALREEKLESLDLAGELSAEKAKVRDAQAALEKANKLLKMGNVMETRQNLKDAQADARRLREALEQLIATEPELREAIDIQENEYTREWFRGWKSLADEVRTQLAATGGDDGSLP